MFSSNSRNSVKANSVRITARKTENARQMMLAFGRPFGSSVPSNAQVHTRLEVMTHEDFIAALKRHDLDCLNLDPCPKCRYRGICDPTDCAMNDSNLIEGYE